MWRMTPEHSQALQLCTYCPKLCRFSCPVSEATHRETLTPWGKMSSLLRTETAPQQATPSAVNVPFACTGCGRCQEYCRHHVDVTASLFPGREHALQSGQAPASVVAVVEGFAGREEALARAVSGWRQTGLSAFHPGCGSLGQASFVEDTRAVLEAVAPGEFAAAGQGSPSCCGYPLYAAGAMEAFQAHIRGVQRHLNESAGSRLLVADPGCAYTFQELYPKYGAPLQAVVETLPTFLEGRLPRQPKRNIEPVQYHDACSLGRRLGVYDAPRRVVQWASGSAPHEFAQSRRDAPCSGGGGLLPQTDAKTADQITQDALALAHENGAHTIATACPTARKRFATAGANAEHWISLVRRALEV